MVHGNSSEKTFTPRWIYIKEKRNSKFYDENLKETSLILPKVDPHNTHVFYVYVVRHPKRDFIIEKLRENDIHVNISYPYHSFNGRIFIIRLQGRDLPITEKYLKRYYFYVSNLSEDEQTKVVNVLKTIDSNYL